MRTATVLFALMPLVACSGGPDEHEVANEHEIAACEGFRSMEEDLGESGVAQADPVELDRMYRGTLTEVYNSAQQANNAEMVRAADSMVKALSAWPLPPSMRDYPIAAAEMVSICSELGQ